MAEEVLFIALIADTCYHTSDYIKILEFNHIILLTVFWSSSSWSATFNGWSVNVEYEPDIVWRSFLSMYCRPEKGEADT